MDMNLPDITGIEATKQILSENSDAKVLAVSMQCSQRHVKEFLKVRGKGYVAKEDAFSELNQAIRTVYDNGTYLSSEVRTEL